ncbi:MAG: TonB-dependent receptor plug domain-containing protein, partial [Flammeovirgaceae bacterium]|nr:TonB-dependent receptor plug domain-containing protein [Flammeovirgaceae bacterium]
MKIVLTCLLCSISYLVSSQDTKTQPVDTLLIPKFLDEIVISANKIPEPRRNVAQQILVMSEPVIKNMNAQTTAELIANSGTVAMQKSQQGGGSPMLRGFEASRVLLVVDGVRMNNLIYRSGHLQNLITTDNNTLARAEILLGPSSTVYGSDALGGVIHLHTKEPQLATDDELNYAMNAFFRYGSVNNEKTSHLDIQLGGKKFGSFTSFTFSVFDDLKMGEKINPSWGESFGERPQYV